MRREVLLLLLRQCVRVFVLSIMTVSVASAKRRMICVWGKDDDGFSSLYEFLCAGRNVTKRRKSARRDEVHFFSITTTTTTITITTMRRGDERERESFIRALSFISLFYLSSLARAYAGYSNKSGA
jgi:hypothetical protein